MNSTVIKVENLSKKFIIAHEAAEKYTSLRDVIATRARQLLGKKTKENAPSTKEEFYALRDVNFEIEAGERVGIIGRNGAGKSTLLKILSRITEPSQGRVSIKGRVSSLLEVGTGFHPELTGRENIFLNGAILGMGRVEIRKKFDEIVAFAEIEKFLDTPVKRYSSGMYVRLAFAVAAHLEPEILIIDEVLAVGDSQFQKKCLGKMEDVSKNQGRTVLFVSHQMDAISRLCEKAIYLEGGMVKEIGQAQSVVNRYLNGDQNISWIRSWTDREAPGSSEVKLKGVKVIDESGQAKENHDIRNAVGIQMEYIVLQDNVSFTHGFNLFSEDGTHILSSHDIEFAKKKLVLNKGKHEATVWIPKNFLSESFYKVSVAIMSYDPFIIHFHETDAVSFSVFDTIEGDGARGLYGGRFPGLIRPILNWTTQKIS